MSSKENPTTTAAPFELRLHDQDVGSPQVQIARLTARIIHLTAHLNTHKNDKHTRRGLMALIARRRKLTAYLKRIAPALARQNIGDPWSAKITAPDSSFFPLLARSYRPARILYLIVNSIGEGHDSF